MADKRINSRSPYYIDSNPPPPNLFTCEDAGFHIINGITGENIVIGVDATVQEGTLNSVFPTTYQSGEKTYFANITAPAGYDNAGEVLVFCYDNATAGTGLAVGTCTEASFNVSDGVIGQSVSASTQNGFILNSVSPSTYQSGTTTYTANITVPSGYSNAGDTLTTCTDTATGQTAPSDINDPDPDPDAPDAVLFTCNEANFQVSDGTVGTTIVIGSDATSNGTLNSVSPSTYQSGGTTYTANITVPSGYSNVGATLTTCTDTATGSPAVTYYYTLVERCDGGNVINVRSTVPIVGVYSSVLYNGDCYEVAGYGTSANTNDITSPYPDCVDCCDKVGGAGGCTTPATNYYSLTRCNPSATGFITGQATTEINLNVNDRVVVGSTYYIVTGTATTGTSVGTVTDTGNTGCPPLCTGIAIYRSINSAEEACCTAKGNVQYFNNTTVATSDKFYAFDSTCTTLHSGTAYIMSDDEVGYYYTFVNGIKTAGPTLCPSCP